jgi:hypothetical protein
MLAMADWANDDGSSLHPSMRSISEKVRVSEKQARRIVQTLVSGGYLEVVGNAYGGAPGTTKNWLINVKKLRQLVAKKEAENDQTPPMGVTPPADVTPPIGVPRPLPWVSQTPPMGVPDPSHGWEPNHHRTTIEPSIEPPIKESARKRTSDKPDDVSKDAFDGWLEVRKAKRCAKPTALVWVAMRREAEKAGLTLDEAMTKCVEFNWAGFEADWYAARKKTAAPANGFAAKPSKHTGFSTMNYSEGIQDDGSFV